MKSKSLITLLSVFMVAGGVSAQTLTDLGNPNNSKYGIHSGNEVRTVFNNSGGIGYPSDKGPRGAWKFDNNGYVGDISLMLGLEIRMDKNVDKNNQIIKNLVQANGDSVYHSVIISDVNFRPSTGKEQRPDGSARSFQPKSGYSNPNLPATTPGIAFSTLPATWPSQWPDKATDPDDPGWEGSWNGYFGKEAKADEESYYVMDDHYDNEFNLPPYNFKPDATFTSREGAGIDVKVRGMQWAQFLAQDCIFWVYEITNTSTTNYNRAVLGLLCGTYVGVTGQSPSGNEYDDDVSFFDVRQNQVYTWDFKGDMRNKDWKGTEIGYVGYAFLESPGNPFDGIDNDRDGLQSVGNVKLFSQADFDSTQIMPGDTLILIDVVNRINPLYPGINQVWYDRRHVTVPGTKVVGDTIHVTSLGKTSILTIGKYVKEGEERRVVVSGIQQDVINPNAFDGFDNDFDGLIDENYYVHYKQKKVDYSTPSQPVTLIDTVNATVFLDYKSNPLASALMIDERRDDGIDNDKDWEANFDDTGADGVLGTGDAGEGDFVPSPGEPDFDEKDVNESDQIGLTSFDYFAPSSGIALGDDEVLWDDLQPGNFSVPTNFANNRPLYGEDGDFTFGSGYFPLFSKTTERFSFALLYGTNKRDFDKNRVVVQQIYDANYRFPQPPTVPTVKAVVDDGKVTLYWDNEAEKSVDPVLKIKDFEGYKVYKSRDVDFADIRLITDGNGNKTGLVPVAQYDIPGNGVEGYFQATSDIYEASSGYTYYLGDDFTGISHKFVDEDVVNGVRYFYAVVAYDRGTFDPISKLDTAGIFPSENPVRIRQNSSGEYETLTNSITVVPQARSLGYSVESSFEINATGTSNSKASTVVVDDTRLIDGSAYEVTFTDISSDGISNDADTLTDIRDANELVPNTLSYSVRQTVPVVETFIHDGTNSYQLQRPGVFVATENVSVKRNDGSVMSDTLYRVDPLKGKLIPPSKKDFPFEKGKSYTVTYTYYGVYQNTAIPGNPRDPIMSAGLGSPIRDDIAFDGLTMSFNNFWTTGVIQDSLRYTGLNSNEEYPGIDVSTWTAPAVQGTAFPYDYMIEFNTDYVDTSLSGVRFNNTRFLKAYPVKFRVKNLTTNKYVRFAYNLEVDGDDQVDSLYKGRFGFGSQIIIMEENPDRINYNGQNGLNYTNRNTDAEPFRWIPTYNVLATVWEGVDTVNTFLNKNGVKFFITTSKPFAKSDVLTFTVKKGGVTEVAAIKSDINKIRVVPNPYVSANIMESGLPPGITSGRGERKMEFRGLPPDSKIYIFTTAGDLVRKLEHTGTEFNGTVAWDLKTRENLEVAAGVYFYVVESAHGKKEGKLAILK